jgi:phosphatidate cytidylyltransferase
VLRHRLPVSVVLIASFVGILIVDGWTAPYHAIWMTLVVLAGILATVELIPLLTATIARPFVVPLFAGTILCLASNAMTSVSMAQGVDSLGPLGCAFVVSIIVAFSAGVRTFDDITPVTPRVASTILGIAYIGVLGSFLAQLRFLNGHENGIYALALVVGATKGTDIGAYTFGKLFGRHLMTPRLSPKKTWEGAAGGLIFAIAIVSGLTWLEGSARGSVTLSGWPMILAFALTVSIAGQTGDLAESMLKRESKVKDASSVIPGFGGILDLLDSLMLAAPAGWAILTVLG